MQSSLIKKHLLSNKTRSIATILAIVLSVALIFGVLSLVYSLREVIIDITKATSGEYHAILKVDDSFDVSALEKDKKIEEIGTREVLTFGLVNDEVNLLIGYDDNSYDMFNIYIDEGRYPKNSNEIIVANNEDYVVGEKISFEDVTVTYNDEYYGDVNPLEVETYYDFDDNTITKGNTHEYIIVGTYEDRFTFDTRKMYTTPLNPNTYILKYYKPKDALSAANYDASLEFNSDLLHVYGVTNNEDIKNALITVASILLFIVITSTILVIYNAFAISTLEQKKLFGILRSVGATKSQIRNMVLKEGILLSIISIPLGIITSSLGIYLTLTFLNTNTNLFDFVPGEAIEFKFIVNNTILLLTIILTLLTVIISALIPAIKSSKTEPIGLIKSSSDIKLKSKKVKTSKLSKKVYGPLGDIANKNFKRNKGKFRITVISISISIIMFITLFYSVSLIRESTKLLYADYDYNIYSQTEEFPNNYSSYEDFITYLDNTLEKDKTIKNYMYYVTAYKYSDNYDEYPSYSIDKSLLSDELKTLADKGEVKISPTYTAISDEVYSNVIKKESLKDNTYLYNNTGYDNDQTSTSLFNKDNTTIDNISISTIKNDYFSLSNHIEDDYNYIYYDYEENILYINVHFIISETMLKNMYDITSYNELSYEDENVESYVSFQYYIDTKDTISTTSLLEANDFSYVWNLEYEKSYTDDMLLIIYTFTFGFIGLISLIGLTNVFNTLYTNIILRKKEFLIYKTIGMTNKQLNTMMIYESLFYGVKSLFYGITIGTMFTYIIYTLLKGDIISEYNMPVTAIVISLTMVMLIIFTTTLYSINLVKKHDIIESIKSEEV